MGVFLFAFFFLPSVPKNAPISFTWWESPIVEASRGVESLWWHLLADRSIFLIHFLSSFSTCLFIPQVKSSGVFGACAEICGGILGE